MPEAIVCAATVSREAHVAVGYDRSRMHVIPNGFDVVGLTAARCQRADMRRSFGLSDTNLVIGAAGRFNPVKDFHSFVRCAGLVARARPDARFVLIGRQLDAGNAELMGWIAAEGLADRFILLGERRDVPACLGALDIFCLSSRSEGFPNVVGEAMAAGLPCVVTDVGDAATLVGNSGVVVGKADPVALADAVLRIANLTPEARHALGAAGQARIDSTYSMEVARQRFADLYRRDYKTTVGGN